MTRRPDQLSSHRLILGGVAIVLMLVSVFVAFKSTRGVPLAPKYNLTVQVPNGAQLVGGADVVVAGVRVGQVTDVHPAITEEGKPAAEAELALTNGFGPLPVGSSFSVRQSGVLGRKNITIVPGTSNDTLDDGELVGLSDNHSRPVVDIDQFIGTFDDNAREGTRKSLEGLGLGLAGRGAGLNETVQQLPETLDQLTPAMQTLNSPSTNLAGFTASLESLGAELAPTSPVIPQMVTGLDRTFSALDETSPELETTLGKFPGFISTTTKTTHEIDPLIRVSTNMFSLLRPGVETLPQTAPLLADALQVGARNLKLVPTITDRSDAILDYLVDYTELPSVTPGFARLTSTASALAPTVSFLAPAENTCRYASLLIRNLNSLASENAATGTTLRATGVVTGVAPDSERGPSKGISRTASGKAVGPIHSNPYPNTAAPGQVHECEAGHEPYVTNAPVVGNVPGKQPATTEDPKDLP